MHTGCTFFRFSIKGIGSKTPTINRKKVSRIYTGINIISTCLLNTTLAWVDGGYKDFVCPLPNKMEQEYFFTHFYTQHRKTRHIML